VLSIGIYTYSIKPRGSVVHAMNLADALVAAGHDATLYALAKPGASLYRRPACPVELIVAAAAPVDADALIRQRIDEFARGFGSLPMRHDVFHAQDCLAANALLAVRPAGSEPIVRTVHHVEAFDSPYLADCQRRSIQDADALLSVSRITQQNVFEQFGRRSRLVHNGVEVARFARRQDLIEQRLSARFGIEPGDAIVLSVGGVEPRKNTLLALQAFAAAHPAAPRSRWVIVGDHSIWDHSPYVTHFEGELARLPPGLRERVVRAGTLPEDEMTSLYSMSDVLLCPSREEGFGLCVLEAMAAGAAVVVPGRAPFTEYLDATCAAFVDSESIDSVSHALVRLLLDVPRRRAIAAAARQQAQTFTWSRSAALHVEYYSAIRSRRTEPEDWAHERSANARDALRG
jgi:glycosyltransferase-like protein